METRTLYIDLDSLLDTRLATLASLDTQAASELVSRGSNYRQRDTDDWTTLTDGSVTTEEFLEAYAKRNKETLKVARPTKAVQLLRQMSSTLVEQSLSEPDVDRIRVVVNTYPYELTEKEEQLIVGAVMVYCNIASDVITTWMSLEEMKPAYIKENWDGVVFYDFDAWLSVHGQDLNEVRMPSHSFIAPALFVKPVDDYQELLVPGLETHTPFEIMEMAMVERLELTLVCPSYFSIL